VIAEAGHALLWLALGMAALQAAGGWVPALRALAVPAAVLQGWLWLWIAGCLIWVFAVTDLSVAGVAATTTAALPLPLKLTAIAVRDGGGLIVLTALAAWAGAVLAFFGGQRGRAVGIAGLGALALTAALLGTAPFARLVPAPTAGAGFPVAVRARLAALMPSGAVLNDGVALVAVTPVAGPDSTGVLAAVRAGDRLLAPEWREVGGTGFPVADGTLTWRGWVAATVVPAPGGRWRVRVTRWPG